MKDDKKKQDGEKRIRLFWTEAYRPFILGGDVHAPVGCMLECLGVLDAGFGVHVNIAVAPNGATFVALDDIGAIVGATLQDVKDDLKAADPEVVKQQRAEATERAKKICLVDEHEFWRLLKCTS